MIESKEALSQSNMIDWKKVRLQSYIGNIIKWILGVISLVIALFPIWWMFNVVFSKPGIPISINPRLYPTSLVSGFENIKTVLSDNQFFRAYMNSTVYTGLEIVGVLFLCSMSAFEFALYDFPGKKILFPVILFALMIPTGAILIPTYLLVFNLGWLNTMQGLVIPGIASAFGLFMLTQFFQDIPREILDAALIDGATHFDVYRFIVIPLSGNALITLAILIFMATWGNFIWPLVIATKADIFTVSQIINRYNDPQSYMTVNEIMTANFLAAVPPLLFFVIFQNKIIKGVSMSGIKG
jgi:multiple sugar transport system permease protein